MITKKEINAIINLAPDKRYEYTIKRIADIESLWVIGDEGGFRTYGDHRTNIVFPLWPFREFAFLCCTGEFEVCQPEELDVQDFLNNYIPDFKNSGYRLSILPLPSDKGSVINIDMFVNDIKMELERY